MPDVVSKIQSLNEGPIVSKSAVIIVAAGRGSRAGEGLPKQYQHVAGKPLLRHTLEALQRCAPQTYLQVVIHPDDHDLFKQATKGLNLLEPALGGSTRKESVLNGLHAVAAIDPKFVLIHDAARPFVTKSMISNIIAALADGAKAVVPTVAIVDTLSKISEGRIVSHVNREGLHAVQTPQGFQFTDLVAAHEELAEQDFTDDGSVMEAVGFSVTTTEGDTKNFKVTYPEDFRKAEAAIMMELADIRVGSGYDVHRFDEGDYVWLGGIKIPFHRSLKGHSDADVALHALTDALLSAISAGDIGSHFPPNDNKWKGASSDIFINKAAQLIKDKQGIIAHITICIICENPKIGPHKHNIQKRIAEMLDIEINRVSVQATTTEKLGFTGREEGIAAQATATVRLPL